VTTRTSSVEALEAFRSSLDKFDLVITDLIMPNMTGDKLIFELKQIDKKVPVILCTGFSEKISREKTETMGLDGFLMKPILKNELAKMVRIALSHKNGDET
jgi:CheY-like chemotaxis protein